MLKMLEKFFDYLIMGVIISFVLFILALVLCIFVSFPKSFIVFIIVLLLGFLAVERKNIKERFLCLKKSWKEEG